MSKLNMSLALDISPPHIDEVIAKLDRSEIWLMAWKARGFGNDSPAGIRRARALIKRWEKLTGRRFHDE